VYEIVTCPETLVLIEVIVGSLLEAAPESFVVAFEQVMSETAALAPLKKPLSLKDVMIGVVITNKVTRKRLKNLFDLKLVN
jgi:hypothetical protein